MTVPPAPSLPDYQGASLPNLVAALTAPVGGRPAWLPAPALVAEQVVLVVLDGLGWSQLESRWALAPGLRAMTGGPITSIAPTTTAAALTSISMGSPPASHGMVGYRMRVPGEPGDQVLNALSWRTSSGDARERVDPATFLLGRPFGGRAVPVVSGSAFEGSGFSVAHLGGAAPAPWVLPSSIPVETSRLMAAGERFVFAYYPGIDKMAHAKGFGVHYDAEVAYTDQLISQVAAGLPAGAAVVVTADHGQVSVGERMTPLDRDLLEATELVSGEARFRWLHARPGAAGDVLAGATERYRDVAWVRSLEQIEAEGWLGGPIPPAFRPRLGDVAVVPFEPIGFSDPGEGGRDHQLVCRHGSLTPDEMYVPLLAAAA